MAEPSKQQLSEHKNKLDLETQQLQAQLRAIKWEIHLYILIRECRAKRELQLPQVKELEGVTNQMSDEIRTLNQLQAAAQTELHRLKNILAEVKDKIVCSLYTVIWVL